MAENQSSDFLCVFCRDRHPVGTETCPSSGNKIPAHYKIVGTTLDGKYRIDRLLGEGGMGAVFEAYHLLIGRKLAVKVLFPEIAENPEIVTRFYNEARTAAGIGHEHIIDITDMGFHGHSPYIVMEHLEGRSLTAHMEGRQLPCDEASDILIQVLDALSAVHAQSVIHRDLKPDNIFLVKRKKEPNFVKILDFGISKLKTPKMQEMALTRTGTILGTPFYMAPEQAAGRKEQDHRIDIYAVGVILYEMLTGKLPFTAENYNALMVAILTEDPVNPRVYNPGIPQEMEDIILTAMAKEPEARFPGAGEFGEALEPFSSASDSGVSARYAAPAVDLAQADTAAVATPPPQGAPSAVDWSISKSDAKPAARGRKGLIAGLAVGALLLLLAGLGLVYGPRWFGGRDPGKGEEQTPGKIEAARPPEPEPEETPEAVVEEKPPAKMVSVRFEGAPEHAVIKVGDQVLQANPSAMEASSDEKIIEIQAEGYEPWTGREVLSEDRIINVAMNEIPAKSGKKKKAGKMVMTADEKPASGPPVTFVIEKEPPEEKATKKKSSETGPLIYKGKAQKLDSDYPE